VRFSEVELGDDLPETHPDISMDKVRLFVKAAYMDFPRFTDHDFAKSEGLPGAIVPGVMSQGFLAAMIHRWAPGAVIHKLDTVFRTTMVVDTSATCRGAVTDLDEENRLVEVDLTMLNHEGVTSVIGTATVELPD